MLRRSLTMEQCEDRIALSAVGFTTPSNLRIDVPAFSARSVFATDNTTNTARDIGSLERPVSIQHQYVGPVDTRDVFRFELDRNGEATIQLTGMTADADIYLLNSERQTVASSRNSGSRSDLIQQDLSAGEYFVVVQNYSTWRGTGYTLNLAATLEPAPDPFGNTFDTAKDLGSLRGTQSFTDFVGRNDGLDVFRFDIDSASQIEANLSGLRSDVDLHLYSDSGSQLISSDRSGTASEQIKGWIAPGSYYLVVDAYESANSNYTLTLSSSLRDPVPSQPARPAPTTPPVAEAPPTTPAPTVPAPTTPAPTTPPTGPLANVPYFGSSSRDWGVNSVNAPEAWAAGFTGQGITVAVIDSGVQTNHADLTHSIWVNVGEVAGDGIDNDGNGYVDDIHGWDFIDRDGNPNDENGHGTHVAGIIAAANNGAGATGVAYASSIMPIRVLDANGSGSTNGVAQGIRYAVDNGAQVINLSLGGGNSQSVYAALRYAEQNNVLVVAASGNESAGLPGYPAAHSASLSNVISVGAYSSSQQRASFSNRVGTSGATQIDAPGQSIYNTYLGGRYSSLSGTSMATPFVSGVAALAWAANPTLTASAMRSVLTQSVGAAIGGSDSLGRLDAAAAIPLAQSGNVSASASSSQSRRVTPQNFSTSQRVYALASTSVQAEAVDHGKLQESADETTNTNALDYLLASTSDRVTDFSETMEVVDHSQLELAVTSPGASSVDDVFAEEDWAELSV